MDPSKAKGPTNTPPTKPETANPPGAVGHATRPDQGAVAAHSHGIARSPQWPHARAKFIAGNPHCVACDPGTPRKHLQVHHVVPFHFCVLLGRPELELDPRNLVTLCEDEDTDHHLLLGHLDHFKSSNPSVHDDATKRFFQWSSARIRASDEWVRSASTRPPEWADMTDDDKNALRSLIERLYGPR